MVAGRRYPLSDVKHKGREEPPHVRGHGWHLRPGAAPETRVSGQEEQPHAQGVVAVRVQEGLEEPSHVGGQEGWREEILLIQGKEQRLCFAGAAVKRYPTPKVRETQVRW